MIRSFLSIFVFGGFACALGGCSLLKERKGPAPETALLQRPLTPEESNEVLSTVGQSWLYGPGLGTTAVTVATSVLFPPYAIYVAGNAVLSISGYEPLEVTQALPEPARDGWMTMYDEVTSVPGRVAAGVSGNDYINREAAKARMQAFLEQRNLSQGAPREN